MPVTPTYPGVYIEEVPSGVRTITGVATSIAAFLGRTRRGPDNEPIIVNNYGDFERTFGGLGVDYPMSYAVNDFFRNGGGQAIIVRLYKAPEGNGNGNGNDNGDSNGNGNGNGNGDGNGNGNGNANAGDPDYALLSINGFQPRAAYKGSWGNTLRARIDHDVPLEANLPPWVKASGRKREELFNLTLHDTATGLTESFVNVTVAESPRRVNRVLANQSQLARIDEGDLPDKIPEAHDILPSAERKKLWIDDKYSTGVLKENKAPESASLDDLTYKGNRDQKIGLYALEKADIFNLLCIPPDDRGKDTPAEVYSEALSYCVERRAMLIVDPSVEWTDFQKAANDMRGGGAYGLSGLDARNAAIYFPRVIQADPLREGQEDIFAPSGLVAGAMARTDVQRGVWKAPAGIDVALNGTRGLSVNLTDDENGVLNPLGINCLRSFPIIGRVMWGARTLRGADILADEYKYVPVRRLALFIEESLYRGTQWVVFEPNDEPLWAQIRLNVGAFMHNLFRQGAFQGSTPREAYFVKCDKETTTQTDINLGIVNIVVGFAPLKPAEFVIIKLQQMAGQIEV